MQKIPCQGLARRYFPVPNKYPPLVNFSDFCLPLPFLLGNPPFIKLITPPTPHPPHPHTQKKKNPSSKFNCSFFFSRIIFYWNSYSFLYFLCKKWIRKIINLDSNVINNRMLLFNRVSIKNQKLSFGQHTKVRLNTLRLTSKT